MLVSPTKCVQQLWMTPRPHVTLASCTQSERLHLMPFMGALSARGLLLLP